MSSTDQSSQPEKMGVDFDVLTLLSERVVVASATTTMFDKFVQDTIASEHKN